MALDVLNKIVDRLRRENTRWDAILELKVVDDPTWVPHLIDLLKDPDWVVRWCVTEKLGDMEDVRAIQPLICLIEDPDYHVRRNAMKALVKFESMVVPHIVDKFRHSSPVVRKSVLQILLESGRSILPDLEKCVSGKDWVVANRVLEVIWRLGGTQAETFLIQGIGNSVVQKHAMMYLGLMRSKRAIPHIICAFEVPKLRRISMLTLQYYSKGDVFSEVVSSISSASETLSKAASSIAVKLGKQLLPTLVQELRYTKANTPKILEVIRRIGPQSVLPKLKGIGQKDVTVRRWLNKILAVRKKDISR